MSDLLSRWLAASATALRTGLALGLAACTFVACHDEGRSTGEPPATRNLTLETVEDTPLEVELSATGYGTLAFGIVDAPDHGTLSAVTADGFVTYTPGADYQGEDVITFRAVDHWGQSSQGKVTITVKPVNDVPTVSPVANQSIRAGASTGEQSFTVGDVEAAAGSLAVTATSSNTALVPNDSSHLVVGGAGASRTVNVIPAAGAKGTTTITLAVSDGAATASTTFTVEVTSPASLYWLTTTGSLWKADEDGSNVKELTTGISGASVIAADPVSRSVFYKNGNAIVRADSEGANPVDIVANGGNVTALTVDVTNRRLLWSDFNGRRVMRAELDGSHPAEVIGGIDSPSGLSVDASNGKVYLITYNNTQLLRFNLDGTQLETLASNLGGQGTSLVVDSSGRKLYFATREKNIYVANMNGTSITPLVTNQTTVFGIAIDATGGRLYWSDWLGQAVRSANLFDGSDIQTVNSGSSRMMGLARLPAP